MSLGHDLQADRQIAAKRSHDDQTSFFRRSDRFKGYEATKTYYRPLAFFT